MHFKEASSSGKLRGSVLFVLQVRVGGGFTICPAAVCPRLRGGAAEGCRGPGPGDLSQWPCDLEWGTALPWACAYSWVEARSSGGRSRVLR